MAVMSIAICDDCKESILELRKHIEKIAQIHEEEWTIEEFTSGEELLRHIEKFCIVFLDIEMPELDGIRTGSEILRANPDCKIIMASGVVERFKEAFYIKAFRFITKPFDEKEIEEALEAVTSEISGDVPIELFYERNRYQVPQDCIVYIRALNGYTEYWVEDKWMRKEITLEEAGQRLDSGIFVRINRQYIVNMRYIQDYHNGILTLNNGNYRVSRRLKKEFEKKYIDYDIKYGRSQKWKRYY